MVKIANKQKDLNELDIFIVINFRLNFLMSEDVCKIKVKSKKYFLLIITLLIISNIIMNLPKIK